MFNDDFLATKITDISDITRISVTYAPNSGATTIPNSVS
jgi:hypothetical protein